MRISFEEVDGKIMFRILGFHPKHEKILLMCSYENDDRGYIKVSPKNAQNLEKIKGLIWKK